MAFSVLPLAILGAIVVASAAQTELAHWVVADLQYDHPYFTFYLTHSTFSLIFPAHLALLHLVSPVPVSAYLASIRSVLTDQLELSSPIPTSSTVYTAPWSAIVPGWSRKVTLLTLLVTVPALSWFVAMQYSTPVDITSIYATSSFAAYGFSLLLLREPLSRVTIGSILLAFAGVTVISLDGMGNGGKQAGKRAWGDGIMLFGAIALGLYEVVYKLALPEGHGGVSATSDNDYTSVPPSPSPPLSPRPSSSAIQRAHSHRTPSSTAIPLETPATAENPLRRHTSSSALILPKARAPHAHVHTYGHPVPLPPALLSNFLTSCIGVATFFMLWPPIIALDWLGYETFSWPGALGGDRAKIWLGLEIVAWGGSLYNAGLMVLIGIWGPTTSSVANLLAIGLVALVDALWAGAMPDLQTFIGVGMICAGFGMLLCAGEE